jgi:SAM-dependent methyltransferase
MLARIKTSFRFRLRRLVYPVALLDRELLARHFISGTGIEIGGLHNPTRVKARVRYVDRLGDEGLGDHYPERTGTVHVDIVDDAQHLSTVADASQDFLIANHVLEHCRDPLGALRNWFRVVRDGGVVFMALPDKRRTFDRDRQITPLAHVAAHADDPEADDWEHYVDYARHVLKTPEAEVEAKARELVERDYSIHFHVWTQREMVEMIEHARARFGLSFDYLAVLEYGEESVFVLRKGAAG